MQKSSQDNQKSSSDNPLKSDQKEEKEKLINAVGSKKIAFKPVEPPNQGSGGQNDSSSNMGTKNMPKSIKTKIKEYLARILDHNITTLIMTLITVIALFGDDVRILSTDKYGDQYFYGVFCFCMFAFAVEILVACWVKPGYFLSFFFWLDLVSTASMIFDIGWISDLMFGDSNAGASNATGAGSLARAGRASRVGTKASKLVRVVRLIRLAKLYKHAQQAILEKAAREAKENERLLEEERRENEEKANYQRQNSRRPSGMIQMIKAKDDSSIGNKPSESFKHPAGQSPANHPNQTHGRDQTHSSGPLPQETNVGRKLSDLTTKKVILLVMSIMFSVPIFSLNTYEEELTSYETGLEYIKMFANSKSDLAYKSLMETFISVNTGESTRYPIIQLYVSGQEVTIPGNDDGLADNLRSEEKKTYFVSEQDLTIAAVTIDIRLDNQLNAILGIMRTILVCVVLTAGAMYFSKDSNELVLAPIENMLSKVRRIAKNPLEAAQIEENENLIMEELKKKGEVQKAKVKKKKGEESTYETTILEKTIIKIGALLALGFGEAGSEIIATNMAKSGDVDPMIPGKKIIAIFGFCDIRNFTDATEVLQEAVMVFVNEIAQIVHGTVDHFSGAANKNIGDAFLLVWKFPDSEVRNDNKTVILNESRVVRQIADMSVISFLKIISGINISQKLKKYKDHPGLNERLPNYKVNMGFGLHVGWAIEGAIGSEFKVDASYLSPNVNMASRLEAATKQFGVPILISGPLYKILTEESQKQLRHIDRVTVKGSKEPLDLYTCDVDYRSLLDKVGYKNEGEKETNNGTTKKGLTKAEKKRQKLLSRHKRNDLKKKVLGNKTTIANLFTTDKELKSMREPYTPEFYEVFARGMSNYFSGNWHEAKSIFEKTQDMIGSQKDGPSKTLLEFIKENGNQSPSDWRGFRELTEK